MKTKQRDYRCSVCGRYFKPDCRTKFRQRICGKDSCRKEQKKRSQAEWLKKNPGYFEGRYPKVKVWREGKPGYQKAWRSKRRDEIQDEIGGSKPCCERELLIPAIIPGSKIQDEILSVRQAKNGLWVVGTKKVSEIQDEMARDLLYRVSLST